MSIRQKTLTKIDPEKLIQNKLYAIEHAPWDGRQLFLYCRFEATKDRQAKGWHVETGYFNEQGNLLRDDGSPWDYHWNKPEWFALTTYDPEIWSDDDVVAAA